MAGTSAADLLAPYAGHAPAAAMAPAAIQRKVVPDAVYQAFHGGLDVPTRRSIEQLVERDDRRLLDEHAWLVLQTVTGKSRSWLQGYVDWLIRRREARAERSEGVPTRRAASALTTTTGAIDPRLQKVIACPSCDTGYRAVPLSYDGPERFLGYKYDGAASNDYVASLGPVPACLEDLLLPGDPAKQIEIYEFAAHTEGGASAINTYDDQIVTFGSGFSGSSGRMGKLFVDLPPELRARLAEEGMAVNDDGSFTVTAADGSVVVGADALHAIADDPAKLSVLIALAESDEQMGAWTAREWTLRSQFADLIGALRGVWSTVRTWDLRVVKVGFKMVHWQPGVVSWSALVGWYDEGGADVMFGKVRAAIVARHPQDEDYSVESVTRRMEQRARDADPSHPLTIQWPVE